jgi:hypothetical protein
MLANSPFSVDSLPLFLLNVTLDEYAIVLQKSGFATFFFDPSPSVFLMVAFQRLFLVSADVSGSA